MLTFREFHSICEGKKEEREKLVRAALARQQRTAQPKVVDYGTSSPHSSERASQIAAMMKQQGGGAIHKTQKEKLKQATKTAKKIEKQKPFYEDIETRRRELAQRQRENLQRFKEKSAASVEARKEAQQKQQEKEKLKQEIKRELQTEQIPMMVRPGQEPNLYNKLIARSQMTRKRAREVHAQREMEREAKTQQQQKRAEMKAILSR